LNGPQYLESLGDGIHDKQKSEYSLTQHLANNMIDMYINLPSKNHYRRPATYASKGYQTRRLAVDFAVPLITNVKVAKLLAEALVRRMPLEVSSVDYKTSHTTHTFPGFVNIAAFVPGLALKNNTDFMESTKAALSSGFTTSLIIPVGHNNQIVDRTSLEQALVNVTGAAHSNFALGITASADNLKSLDEEMQDDTKFLFIPFRYNNIATQVSVVASHFASWPTDKPIVTDAKGSDLASVLLLASLNNRSLHITDVQTKDDLLLISLSKAKNLKVTCDVCVYTLFFSQNEFPETNCLPSVEDQEVLWKNLDVIDAFSVGGVPYILSLEQKKKASSWSGVQDALPLLLTAVVDGRLTLGDIQQRLHDNPIRIFGLPDKVHTHVEVAIGRTSPFSIAETCWSPVIGGSVRAAVHRVLIHGQTAFLDGVLVTPPTGRDVSGATISHVPVERSMSISSSSKPDLGTSAANVRVKNGPIHPQTPTQPSTAISLSGALGTPGQWYHPAFHRRHILSVKQFGNRDIHELFSLAHEIQLQVERNGTLEILKGKVLCTLFYEPSTRTSSSFDAAMKRCGGQVIQVTVDSSSVQKGESLPDTIRTVGCYADAIVLRHPDVGSSQLAAKFSPVPVLNAGDGTGEHPTQVRVKSVKLNDVSHTALGAFGCVHNPF
jgi:carbamoyl-phosphate synthase / aspartate carbamoyltransferase